MYKQNIETMKTCNKCGKTKSLEHFSRNRRASDGLQSNCKSCNRIDNRKYKKDNPKYWAGWQKKNQKRWASYMNQWSKKNEYKVQKRFHQSHNHKPVVYILPEEMYVGLTQNLYKRMASHNTAGKDTTNWAVLREFDDRREAEEYEHSLQLKGYKGDKRLDR